MLSSKTESVVLAVDGNVLLVALGELLDSGLDGLHAAGLAHLLGGDVGVETRSVPVTLDRLGVERDLDAKVLSYTVEEVTSDPEVVTH